MSIPREPKKAKLIIGLFLKEKHLLKSFASALQDEFGPVDMVSRWIAFDFTDYYEREMGAPLFRRLLAFERLVRQKKLAHVKCFTNELESQYVKGGKRRINADPGILTQERFVLATGKNFTHRIYLENGIFADLTLTYSKGQFQYLPWTYPDYKDHRITGFLEKVRNKYLIDLKKESVITNL